MGIKTAYVDFWLNYKSYGNKVNGKVVGIKKIYTFFIYTFFL